MDITEVVAVPKAELERLRAIEAAARAYWDAQDALWDARDALRDALAGQPSNS